MELYIVRHGETDWNKLKRFQGNIDIELNEKGRELAGLLGARFEKENITFERIYSSPLNRAYETACLIRGHQNVKIFRDERLKEISFGGMEGTFYDDWMNTDNPRKYFFSNAALYVPPEGGESFPHLMERSKAFVQNEIEPLYKDYGDKKILLVAHGALIAGLTCYLENRDVENYWGKGLKGNCEETVYIFDGKSWSLK